MFLLCSGRCAVIRGKYNQRGWVVKRLVAVLLLVAGMYSPSWAQSLSERAFTEEVAKALRSAVPSARITIPKNLEVRIRYASGEDFTAVLTTAYKLYREGSESLERIISVHVSKYSTPMTPQEAARYASRLECGTAWVNQHGTLHPLAPFGGVKHSGIGVEFNVDGLKEYTTVQVVNVAL